VPLVSTRSLIVAAVVIGLIVLVIAVVAPALRPAPQGQDPGTLGSPSRVSTGPAPPDPIPHRQPPVPERPAVPPPLPTGAADVIRTFPQALRAVRARLGRSAQLTDLNVNEISVLFSHRLGRSDRAAVLRWRPERHLLELADPRFAGPGSAAEAAFSIAAVRPGAPARLIAQVRRLAPRGHVVHTVHLFRLPVTHALIWQVSVEAGGRHLTYRARPDGSHLFELR
jgi:hypothetical protein